MASAQQKRDVAAGVGLVGVGAGVQARANQITAGVANVRRRAVGRSMARRTGTLGGLSAQGKPVDPLSLSGKRRNAGPGKTRFASPRREAELRFANARAPYEAKIARGLGRAHLPVKGAVIGAGLGAVYAGGTRIGRAIAPPNEHGVHKAIVSSGDFLTSQDLVGIPPWRRNPVDPLMMHASSSIMAGVLVGASGRNLTRRQKKRIRAGAYRFVGAQHTVVSPTGMRGLVTP